MSDQTQNPSPYPPPLSPHQLLFKIKAEEAAKAKEPKP